KDCQPVRVAHADGNLDETWSNAMRPFPDDARNLQIGIEHVHGDTPQQLQSHQRFARAGTNRTQGPRRPSEEKGEYATQQNVARRQAVVQEQPEAQKDGWQIQPAKHGLHGAVSPATARPGFWVSTALM